VKWLRSRDWTPTPSPEGVLARVRALSVRFGERTVLNGVELAVRAGELVALVGPNGAGKSTLFGAMCGDIAPSAGTVEVAGRPVTSLSHVELARYRAVLPQQATVGFPFTVADIVRMGRAPWTGTAAEDADDEIVVRCMGEMGVTALAARQFPSLSGGERARVALARVLAQATRLVLLDEPTAALDVHHQELAMRVVRARVDEGMGAVVVLHDLAQAAAYADRIVVLADGAVVADGPPPEVLTAGLLSKVYHHEIEVLTHPRTGALLILPVRTPVPERAAGA